MSTIFKELKQYKELHTLSHLAFPTTTGRSSAIKPSQLTEITFKNSWEFNDIELWQEHVGNTFSLCHVEDCLQDEAKCKADPTASRSLFTHIGQAPLDTNCDAPVEAHKASTLVSALCKAVDTTLNTPAHKDSKMSEEIKKLLNARLDQHTDGPVFMNQWKSLPNHFKKNNIKTIDNLCVACAILLNGIEDEGYLQCESHIAKNRNEDLDTHFTEINNNNSHDY